jgi:hypothetical protein
MHVCLPQNLDLILTSGEILNKTVMEDKTEADNPVKKYVSMKMGGMGKQGSKVSLADSLTTLAVNIRSIQHYHMIINK